jgi:hypothetical protein
MTMSRPPAGPATRAVLDRYEHDVRAHRRRVLIGRAVTVAFVLWVVVGSVVMPAVAASSGGSVPLFASVSPVPVLIIWLLLRWQLADTFGTRGEPAFPHRMLEIAAEQDAAAAAPRPFGAVPASMRVYHPEHR